jgi:site-specific recombinase XerD
VDDRSALTFTSAAELYIADMRALGRLTTERSAEEYRRALLQHAADAATTDPRASTRDDVKLTLRRWSHPNTQRRRRSMLVSFYDWMVEEGLRPDNPARQTRAARGREPRVHRLTLEEARRFLAAARAGSERRIAYLGVCAGLRRNEMRLLQGRHFARDGWIWIPPELAKGGRERWVPVIRDLEPIVRDIRETTDPENYVLPATVWVAADRGMRAVAAPERPCHAKTIWGAVRRIGRRAGIATNVHPHLLRHAFAEHVTRHAGLRTAQALLGHATIQTTEGYLTKPSLDELAHATASLTFGAVPAANLDERSDYRRAAA